MASDTGGNTGGDRIDGRAGPKSENVVLQKSSSSFLISNEVSNL